MFHKLAGRLRQLENWKELEQITRRAWHGDNDCPFTGIEIGIDHRRSWHCNYSPNTILWKAVKGPPSVHYFQVPVHSQRGRSLQASFSIHIRRNAFNQTQTPFIQKNPHYHYAENASCRRAGEKCDCGL
jgi:hypothetical protein